VKARIPLTALALLAVAAVAPGLALGADLRNAPATPEVVLPGAVSASAARSCGLAAAGHRHGEHVAWRQWKHFDHGSLAGTLTTAASRWTGFAGPRGLGAMVWIGRRRRQ